MLPSPVATVTHWWRAPVVLHRLRAARSVDSEVKRTGLGDRVLLFNHVFAPGEQWSEDIQIPTGLPITGVMQRPDGGPFGSWWVKLSRAGVERERGIEQGSVRVETDDAGRFEFQHVPPGAWTLTYGGPSQHRSVSLSRRTTAPWPGVGAC